MKVKGKSHITFPGTVPGTYSLKKKAILIKYYFKIKKKRDDEGISFLQAKKGGLGSKAVQLDKKRKGYLDSRMGQDRRGEANQMPPERGT